MIFDAEVKRLVQTGGTEGDLRAYLAQTGWKNLRQKALEVVERGESTLEEVLRVTRSEAVEVGDPSGSGGNREEDEGGGEGGREGESGGGGE
jgi:hypothetical protein